MKRALTFALLIDLHLNSRAAPYKNLTRKVLSTHNEQKECSIYLAPSSVNGLEGFGIFTTRDIDEGDSILSGPDMPSIPILDYLNHDNDAVNQFFYLFNDYWWAHGQPDHVSYEAATTADFQTTFGAFPNHHCILDSLEPKYSEPAYDDSLHSRFKDPGAGAYSYNQGREWVAGRNLEAGDEIFLNYGYCEREENEYDWTAHIPMPVDYEEAATIAWKWLMSTCNDSNFTIPIATDNLVAALLPDSVSHLKDIIGYSSTSVLTGPKDLIPLLAKYIANTPRTPESIRNDGLCLEHLVPGTSNIKQAGMGAFAQHYIRKDEIVVPAPMLHIIDRDALIMHDENGNPNGSQLLLNYCLGHPESSLLLCPGTNAGLINHCSERKEGCGSKGPNAMYRWSTGWDPASDKWLQMSMTDLSKESGRGLSMEVVALRDIEPGEEVFVDYGIEWEQAWEEHVRNWNPPPMNGTRWSVTAKEANEQESLKLLVTGDLRKISEHPYLFTGCQYDSSWEDDSVYYSKEYPNWEEMDDSEVLNRFADSGEYYQGYDYETHGDDSHWPCTVIQQDNDGSYTVRIHQVEWERDMPWYRNGLPRLLTDYPRVSIRYFVNPYASDQHLSGAFRHPIGVPDDIFPEQWKNRRQRYEYRNRALCVSERDCSDFRKDIST